MRGAHRRARRRRALGQGGQDADPVGRRARRPRPRSCGSSIWRRARAAASTSPRASNASTARRSSSSAGRGQRSGGGTRRRAGWPYPSAAGHRLEEQTDLAERRRHGRRGRRARDRRSSVVGHVRQVGGEREQLALAVGADPRAPPRRGTRTSTASGGEHTVEQLVVVDRSAPAHRLRRQPDRERPAAADAHDLADRLLASGSRSSPRTSSGVRARSRAEILAISPAARRRASRSAGARRQASTRCSVEGRCSTSASRNRSSGSSGATSASSSRTSAGSSIRAPRRAHAGGERCGVLGVVGGVRRGVGGQHVVGGLEAGRAQSVEHAAGERRTASSRTAGGSPRCSSPARRAVAAGWTCPIRARRRQESAGGSWRGPPTPPTAARGRRTWSDDRTPPVKILTTVGCAQRNQVSSESSVRRRR